MTRYLPFGPLHMHIDTVPRLPILPELIASVTLWVAGCRRRLFLALHSALPVRSNGSVFRIGWILSLIHI